MEAGRFLSRHRHSYIYRCTVLGAVNCFQVEKINNGKVISTSCVSLLANEKKAVIFKRIWWTPRQTAGQLDGWTVYYNNNNKERCGSCGASASFLMPHATCRRVSHCMHQLNEACICVGSQIQLSWKSQETTGQRQGGSGNHRSSIRHLATIYMCNCEPRIEAESHQNSIYFSAFYASAKVCTKMGLFIVG